jgi:uncharacterized integral membrane protein
MQFLFIVLTVLLLAVALFALQNSEVVTVRFWPGQFQASLAAVILGATAVGAIIAWLLGLAGRLHRWQRSRRAGPGGVTPPDASLLPPGSPGSGPPARPST